MEDKYLRRSSIINLLFSESIPRGYNIWNGFLSARDVANSRVKWCIGNGEKTLFQQGNWLIQGPLIVILDFERQACICIQRFGRFVSNYREGKDQRDLSAISVDLKPFMTILLFVVVNEDQDKLV